MAINNNLNDFFTDIADAIREKLPSQTGNAQTAEQYNTLLTEKTGYGVDPTSHFKTIFVRNNHRIYFEQMKNSSGDPYLLTIDAHPAVISTNDVTITPITGLNPNLNTLTKFNEVLYGQTGWTVTQDVYDAINTYLFNRSSVFPNIMFFGVGKNASESQASELWVVMNNENAYSGRSFDMSDITVFKDSGGIKLTNNTNIGIDAARLYNGSSDPTVISNYGNITNYIYHSCRNLNPGQTAILNDNTSYNLVGLPFQSICVVSLSVTVSSSLGSVIVSMMWFHLKNGAWGDYDWEDQVITDPGDTITIPNMDLDGNPFTNEITIIQKYSPTQFADLIRSI